LLWSPGTFTYKCFSLFKKVKQEGSN